MKTTLTPWLTPLLWLGLLAAAPDNPELQRKYTWVEPDDAAATEIRQLADPFIQQTGSRMLSEVNRVLAKKTPLAAIDDLHLKELKLPAAPAGPWKISALKRTSLRVRNPVNSPDNADLAALMSIQTAMADGNSPPGVLVQKVEAADGLPAEWRVYRPMVTTGSCIGCHGVASAMDPAVVARLEALYPSDKAKGYAANEWRGVIRVSIVPAESTAPKKP